LELASGHREGAGGGLEEEVLEGVDGAFDGFGVTATHVDDHGEAELVLGFEDELIALPKSVPGELEVSQVIFGERINSSLEEHEVEAGEIEICQGIPENGQVGLVLEVIGQGDIEIALLLAEGEIALAVEGTGEDFGAVSHHGGGAVALMDIEVENEDLIDFGVTQGLIGADREVVEDAVAGSAIVKGMVGAASHVGSDAAGGQGVFEGAEAASDEAQRSFDDGRRPWTQADAADDVFGQGSAQEAIDVIAIVHAQDFGGPGEAWALELNRGMLLQSFRDQSIAVSGEANLLMQSIGIDRVVVNSQHSRLLTDEMGLVAGVHADRGKSDFIVLESGRNSRLF
jgi:hypothetical protein